MTQDLHKWWSDFGRPIDPADSAIGAVRRLAAHLVGGSAAGVALLQARQTDDAMRAAILLDVEVERPQDLAAPIKGVEPIAVVFGNETTAPAVLALRPDFPETMHQNWAPADYPRALCIDDRPWQEARLTYTPSEFLRRIQLWLSKAAAGELHDQAQPLEPLFFHNPMTLVVPRAVLRETDSPVELIGFRRHDNDAIIITQTAQAGHDETPAFVVVCAAVPPQGMSRIQFAPQSLDALAGQLSGSAFDLRDLLQRKILEWAGLGKDAIRRLHARIALVIAFPVSDSNGRMAHDLRAFITHDCAGDVGVALGILAPNDSGVGTSRGYVRTFGAVPPAEVPSLRIEPSDVHVGFDRDSGATISGQASTDRRKAVLIGAGSLGSHLAVNLAREGRFTWTIIDDDILLPHNFARHALFPYDLGAPKAPALAQNIGILLAEPVSSLRANLLNEIGPQATEARLDDVLSSTDYIFDASASVAVSRQVSDLPGQARRISIFFNPAGTAVVMLAEDATRDVSLRDLEAQYHRMILKRPELSLHLQYCGNSVRYSGSCRAATNRISASSAALLAAIASRAMAEAADAPSSRVSIWSLREDHSVLCSQETGDTVHRVTLGPWTISYSSSVAREIEALRAEKLPDETGGVLLGVVDTSRQMIHIVQALAAPLDSSGSPTSFERGVLGLRESLADAAKRSLHQVRYVGEWHSHPSGSSSLPSATDIQQMCWLTQELESEGLPALMGIAADNGAFTVLLGRSTASSAEAAQ